MSSNETEKTTFIKNARIFDGERVLDKQTVIIKGEKIINVGGPAPSGAEIVDAKGCTLLPGLIDAHIHVESSMLIPSEFARLAVIHGTVGSVSDPHEIANVLKYVNRLLNLIKFSALFNNRVVSRK